MTSDRLVRNRIIGGRIVERPPRTTGAPATMMQFPITRQHNVIEKGVIDGLRDVRRYELPKIDHGCDGFPVNVICRVPGMPDRGTVRRWERHNAEFRRMIQRGREFGADTLAAEVVEIADAATIAPDRAEPDSSPEMARFEDRAEARRILRHAPKERSTKPAC